MYKAGGSQFFCLTITLLSLLCAGPSAAGEFGTLVLKDGARLEHVSFDLNKTYQVIEYRQTGESEKQYVSFSDIEAILDEDGINVAPDLLGRWYRPSYDQEEPSIDGVPDTDSTSAPVDTLRPVPADNEAEVDIPAPAPGDEWRRENDEVYRRARQRFWSALLRFGGNLDAPLGSYYDGVNSGLGFEFDLSVALTYRIALRLSYSRSGLNIDDDFFSLGIPQSMLLEQHSSLKVNRYMVSAVYYSRLGPDHSGREVFHAAAGMGVVEHRLAYSATVTDFVDIYTHSFKDSETKFAFTGDIGTVFLITDAVGLDISLAIDQIIVGQNEDKSYWDPYNVDYAFIFNFKFGIVALF